MDWLIKHPAWQPKKGDLKAEASLLKHVFKVVFFFLISSFLVTSIIGIIQRNYDGADIPRVALCNHFHLITLF